MNSVSSIALSGLSAAQSSLDAAGHNIANLATNGFRREQVVATARPGGGVDTRREPAEVPGAEPATDLVGLLSARSSFQANLAVFKTADAMMASLLDTVA